MGVRGVSDLVTGEAVMLEMRLAKLASRSLALAIDLAVQLVVLLIGVLRAQRHGQLRRRGPRRRR